MGMAASQARFLQLTARKTNIEYMGQQINQQRLALANQSAGLFEKMLTLEPPVPPSSLDDKYYTQGYTFSDATDDAGNAVFRGDDVNKKISWSRVVGDPTSPSATGTAMTLTDGSVGGTSTIEWQDLAEFADAEDNVVSGGGFDGVQMDANLVDLATAFGVTAPQDDTDKMVIRAVTVEHAIYDPDGNYQTVQEQMPAILEFDNLNRLINMTLLETLTTDADLSGTVTASTVDTAAEILAGAESAPSTYTVGQGESLTYSGVFDETTYNDDMNKYEFEKSAYDYQIERINIETAQIQKQDKSLELKMKQLDTEHRAVQTEMDAVQKVIQKNIESSFKTFA